MPEGLSAAEVGKEISEHHEHTAAHHAGRDRVISIAEAVLLSVVALMAAWSGYSAAKWGTDSSLSLANSSSAQSKANLAELQALQIRTLDSVSFNTAVSAYETHNVKLFKLAIRRLRPGYRPAVQAWLATHPLKNPTPRRIRRICRNTGSPSRRRDEPSTLRPNSDQAKASRPRERPTSTCV